MSNIAFRRVISKRARGVLLFCMVLAVLAALPVLTGQAAVITVDTTDDEFNDGTDCSLREAIQAANTNADFGGCVGAGSYGTDTINLDAATYTLTLAGAGENANATGDLDITSNMTIEGQGAHMTTIDGNGIDRVFDITDSNIVIINNVTITGGSSTADGGGIRNFGDLTLLDGVAVDNNNTSGSANAGGILNGAGGMLEIENSTISNNTTDNDAGGIQNSGTLEMINSTISGNTAAGDAGGIDNSGTVELNNVTITDNTAAGGDGGGIFNDANLTFTLSNTIIADNNDNDFSTPDCFTEVNGDLASDGFNILGNNAGCGGLTDGVNGDQVGTGLSPINPMLGPLTNNGGTTETHLPQDGSPAIDAGRNGVPPSPAPTPTVGPTPTPTPINSVSPSPSPLAAVEPSQAGSGPACEATDQRGEPRPVDLNDDGNAICDIGAVERQTDDTGGGGDGGTGNCSIAGESVKVSSAAANVLISLIPAFAIGFRMLRKRARKIRK
ncbi:MAG TPA: choice-of-anchor Q domain-containing protein [Thermodesulfobacteriota bacterium]|nr:choice-of-anchor Q domain-containing protein [Thermodesulfobacteriota bacterium]